MTGGCEWQLDGFFTNENGNEFPGALSDQPRLEDVLESDPVSLRSSFVPVHYREFACFANLRLPCEPALMLALVANGRTVKPLRVGFRPYADASSETVVHWAKTRLSRNEYYIRESGHCLR
jgi:hypothetical protein